MIYYICDSADKCKNDYCSHKVKHEKRIACNDTCYKFDGVKDAKCIAINDEIQFYL